MSGNGDNSGGAILELGDYNDQVPPSPFPEPIKEEEASVEGRNVPMPDVTLEEELSESLMPLKWVFFPEADPVQQFRGKPWREKIWVFLKGVFPILAWLPEYDWRYYLLGDIIGGVSIAVMSVPQDVSYAKYANMPAEFALRTSFIPPLLYAIQGSSKHLVIAPVSVISQLLGTSVSALANPATDPALYTSLVVTATFFCGLFQLIMGLCRSVEGLMSATGLVLLLIAAVSTLHQPRCHCDVFLRPLPTHHGAVQVSGGAYECAVLVSASGLVLLLGTSLPQRAGRPDPATQTALYTSLAVTPTFFCGLFQFIMGLCRGAQGLISQPSWGSCRAALSPAPSPLLNSSLSPSPESLSVSPPFPPNRFGFLVDFLNQPTIVGFLSGCSLTIAIQQLNLFSLERLSFTPIFCFARFGFLVDFLNQPTIVGFLSGCSLTIAIQQLKLILGLQQLKLILGYKDFTLSTSIVNIIAAIVQYSYEQQLKLILGYKDFMLSTSIVSIIAAIVQYSYEFQWKAFVMGVSFFPFPFQWKAFVMGISFFLYLSTVRLLHPLAWAYPSSSTSPQCASCYALPAPPPFPSPPVGVGVYLKPKNKVYLKPKNKVYLKPKNKVFYYLNALGPLTSILISTIIVAAAGLTDKGIPTVSPVLAVLVPLGPRIGKISTGLHGASSISYLNFSRENVADVATVGFIACLVSLAESVGIARTFASLYGYHLDGNKEMVAFGSMNLVGSFTSCYVATGSSSHAAINVLVDARTTLTQAISCRANTCSFLPPSLASLPFWPHCPLLRTPPGSFSRTAVNMLAGAKTALTQVIMALLILLVLLVAAPLFKNVPNCVVGAVIANAALNLTSLQCVVGASIDNAALNLLGFHATAALWRVDQMDFLVISGCFLAILFGSPGRRVDKMDFLHVSLLLPFPPYSLLFHSPLPYLLPIYQLDFHAAWALWRVDKMDFLVMSGCFPHCTLITPSPHILPTSSPHPPHILPLFTARFPCRSSPLEGRQDGLPGHVGLLPISIPSLFPPSRLFFLTQQLDFHAAWALWRVDKMVSWSCRAASPTVPSAPPPPHILPTSSPPPPHILPTSSPHPPHILPTSFPPSQLDFHAAWALWRVDKMDFLVRPACFLAILFGSPEIGLLVAILLSLIKLLLRSLRPHIRLISPRVLSLLPHSAPNSSTSMQRGPCGESIKWIPWSCRAASLPSSFLILSTTPSFPPHSLLLPQPHLSQLDFHAAWALWKVDKMDFLVMSGCFLAILFGSPEIGLLVAILLSIIKILLRSLRPHIRLLGLLPNAAATAVSVLQFPNSALCEGIVMLRVESPLYFPGANFVRQRVKKLCDAVESPLYFQGANFVRQRVKKLCDAYARGYQQPVKHCVLDRSVMHAIDVTVIEVMRDLQCSRPPLPIPHSSIPLLLFPTFWQHCVLDLSVMHDIDVTAIEAMRDLHRDLTQMGIQLCLASANRDVLRKMFDAQLLAEIGEQRLFLCLASANRDVLRKMFDAQLLAEIGEQWLFVTPADAVKLCRAVALSQPAAKETEELLNTVPLFDI
ncbi:unnamed protein product [Closterium sp. NIES-64]|nr:unnamed protein product [Closterium sp. NIES-64]